MTTCASCRAPMSGPFCARCGQRAREGRLTLRTVAGHVVEAFDVNRGLLFTALELSRRPGAAIREYVDGQTVRFTNPVKYFLILATLTTLAYVATGAAAEMEAEMIVGATHESPDARLSEALRQASEVVRTYLNLVMAASVPFSALATRLLFRRAGMNLAEHAVFNLYAYAHTSLFFVAALVAGMAAGISYESSTGVYLLLTVAYIGWAAQGFFQMRLLPALLRSAVAMFLTSLVYSVVVVAGIGAYAAVLMRR
ncbi:MAG TPA: DUF3667 domain-containing protein [Longimicrobium sp.]